MAKKIQNTEVRILEAAKKVFHRKGFEGTRMQEIADEAGINKSLLHYYFRTKENLFDAVFKAAFREIFTKLFTTVDSNDPLEKKLKNLINEYIGFLQKNSYLPGFILAELNQNPDKIIEVFKSAPVSPSMLIEKMKKSVNDEKLEKTDVRELFINILALCIFPIIARPMLQHIFEFSDEEFDQFIEKRKKELPVFIMNAIRKK
ncbi:MAG TPA: helix-turn-helix domain-containing protein [Bacteroidales bacterium]|nr:helix-turn-helix domain-containing protein [Bacteroidales bacterium]